MKNTKKFTLAHAALLQILFILFCAAVSAQTMIGNTPSTDVVQPGGFYGEFTFGSHFDSHENGGFRGYGFRALYGLTRNLEIGANVAYTRDGDVSPIEAVPNFKWKVLSSEKRKIAVSTGAMLFVPLKAESGTRPEAMIYANASKEIAFAKGMRFAAGTYALIGSKAGSGDKSGIMLGYEKPLLKRLGFYADWYSGKNRLGATGAGLSFSVTPKQVIAAGYNFGNTGRGNNSLTISYGFFR